jgi:hypothetical protein
MPNDKNDKTSVASKDAHSSATLTNKTDNPITKQIATTFTAL